jgi:hypothetical protein
VPYVICLGESASPSMRAYHPDEVQNPNSNLQIGEFIALFFANIVFIF